MKIPFLLTASLCGTALLVPGFSVVAQAQKLSTAGLEAVNVPQGGERYSNDAAPFAGVLNALAKDKDVKRVPTGEEAQVWMWRGENYKPERVSMVKMGFHGALTQAGFSVKDAESSSDRISIFDFFDANDTNAPFYPNPWKLPSYFSANNGATGKALVGVWMESNDALVLAVLPVAGEKKAGVASAPRPVSPSTPQGNAIMVSDGDNAMKGVTAPPNPPFTAMARKPGTVRGQIKDAAGRPVAGATVSVQAGALGGFTTQHVGRSNAQGIYEVAVPVGLCRVSAAWCQRDYNGVTFALPLQSADGTLEQFDNRKGHTENFVLRTWGKTSPTASHSNFQSYYGGALRISRTSSIQEGGTLEITLVPQGRLLDGTVGRSLVYRAPNVGFENHLNNIPLGRYKMMVKLVDSDTTAPVQVEKFPSNQVGDSVTIDFEPVSFNQPDFGYCPVRQLTVMLHP